MKKTYIKPSMEVVNVVLESHMMSNSGTGTPNIGVLPGEEGDEMLSNDRRGSWGNLWD